MVVMKMFVAKTDYSIISAFIAVILSPITDCSCSDCLRYKRYDRKSGDVYKVLPTHPTMKDAADSKPYTHNANRAMNILDLNVHI